MIYYQVKRVLSKPLVFKQILRCLHNEKQSTNILFPLQNRKLLKVAGNDASHFLHGLITNDMEHFSQGAHSMYAMFLNNKGRVLFDTIIYKCQNEKTFFLECDESVLVNLMKHLRIYKLRSAVQIEHLSKLKVWAYLPAASPEGDLKVDSNTDINIYKDPRISDLGYRIVSSDVLTGSQLAKNINKDAEVEDSEEGYKYLRYKLGVSEGADDLPPGTCFPLEANCDYLHGVSFHKGCYIGQEVTARVHHTGVVRKRIMPLKITNIVGDIEKDATLSAADKPKTNFGKIKGVIRDYGLGLVRIKEAMDAKVLKVGESTVEPVKPAWWPVEAPKEKAYSKTEESTDKKAMGDSKKPESEEPVSYEFVCSSCNLNEKADYKGTNPPFSRNIDLKYPSYVMKDPFSPPGKGEILVLGADCASCDKPICINKECSIFYIKIYCLRCAENMIDNFPLEIKNKIAQLTRK